MKKIEIISDMNKFTDVREDIRCPHYKIKNKMARFRRIYSNDGDSIVVWTWNEKEIKNKGCGKDTKRYRAFIGWSDGICGVGGYLCDECSLNTEDKKPTGYDVKNNIIRELTDEEIKQDCKDS